MRFTYNTHTPDTIVHFGAGRGQNVEEYLAAGIKRIELVEANPANVLLLRERAVDSAGISVHNTAISGQTGPASLHVFNLDACTSLRQPTGLMDIFPGLQEMDRLAIQTMAAATFVAGLSLSSDGQHALIVDTPGEELTILQSLAKDGSLGTFSHVRVHCSREPLYADAASAKKIQQLLESSHFIFLFDQSADPDFSDLIFSRDTNGMEVRRLTKEMTDLEAEFAKANEQLARVREELNTAHAANRQLVTEIKRAEAQLELIKDVISREKSIR